MTTTSLCEKCGEHMFRHGVRDGNKLVCPERDEGGQGMSEEMAYTLNYLKAAGYKAIPLREHEALMAIRQAAQLAWELLEYGEPPETATAAKLLNVALRASSINPSEDKT